MNIVQEVEEARLRLAQRFVHSNVQIGGKGTQRRKKKVIHAKSGSEAEKIDSILKCAKGN